MNPRSEMRFRYGMMAGFGLICVGLLVVTGLLNQRLVQLNARVAALKSAQSSHAAIPAGPSVPTASTASSPTLTTHSENEFTISARSLVLTPVGTSGSRTLSLTGKPHLILFAAPSALSALPGQVSAVSSAARGFEVDALIVSPPNPQLVAAILKTHAPVAGLVPSLPAAFRIPATQVERGQLHMLPQWAIVTARGVVAGRVIGWPSPQPLVSFAEHAESSPS